MIALDASDVSYRFPHAASDALRHVSWQVQDGSVTLVVGPSGSGKTTLLRCLNGLVPHFHGGSFGGQVHVLGRDTRVNSPRDLAHTVGFVFQDPESQMVTDLVEDEIVFGMENLGFDRRTMRIRLEETLDLLGISHLRTREIATLSGGERQRVAIAAALVTHPEILVLDEPTSQLDPLAAHDILRAVESLNNDLGMTIVIAEHRIDRVLPFAERIVAMQHGAAIEGSVQEMVPILEDVPPLLAFARWVGWEPMPLTIREARRRLPDVFAMPDSPPPATHGGYGRELVRAERISHRFDTHQALHDVSLSGHAGEVIGIIGRNGSGKTTLLKHLNGLLRPQHGRVFINGNDIGQQSVQTIGRTVGYVPQHPTAILHQETLRDELAFTACVQNRTIDPQNILGQLGIAAHLDHHPLDLSGGERQRAALAAIAVTQPDVLLLDEPTRGLPGLDKQMLARFIRDYATGDRLVLVATHDVEFLANVANRVIMLAEGEVIADGTLPDVLSGSLAFSTQMNRLLRGHVQTLADAQTAWRLGAQIPD